MTEHVPATEDAMLRPRVRPAWVGTITVLLSVVVMLLLWQALVPPTWEYVVVAPADDKLQSEMQRLGAEGWDIASARRATSKEGGEPIASYELILKRRGWWLSSVVNGPEVGPVPSTR